MRSWRSWPPTRALELERGEQFEEPLSNEPRAFTSEIDPQYPVFGNPLTSTVRRNFAAARDEIEDLYRRIAELEASGGGGGTGSGTVTSVTAGVGLTGGTITGAGTIALATPVSLANGGTGVSAANAVAALTALGGAPLTSPNFNGVPTAPTAAAGTATMQLATTQFVENAVGTAGGGTMMSITAGTGLTGGTITTSGTIALDVPVSLAEGGTGIAAVNAAAALAALGGAGLASPAFTGTPTAPTPAAADDSMAIATTAFVKAAVDAIDALPTGGAQYEVLSKASATAGDVEWRGAGVRPNSNTVIGTGSLPPTTTGDLNVAIGVNALTANTSGRLNVAIGRWAMTANTQGDQCVAMGHHALRSNTTGRNNTGVGRETLGGNDSGDGNAAFGDSALSVVRGSRNVAIGAVAGTGITSAGTGLNLANGSVFIGYDARALANDPSNEIVIGSSIGTTLCVGHGSNTITLGNEDVTALYTHAGLVLGDNPTGGAKGPGTVNCTGPIYVNDVEVGGASGLPTGGAQYEVLTKASTTDGDVGWAGVGVRPNNNTVIGAGAFSTVGGSNNTAIGNNALRNNSSAALGGNTAIGSNALSTAPSFYNTAVGTSALAAATSSVNQGTAIGYSALANLTIGIANVAIGAAAGSQRTSPTGTLTDASNCIYIGQNAYANADGVTNEIVIGSGGRGQGSNTIVLGDGASIALYTRAGLVLSNPTGGAKGPGTINCTDGVYVNNVKVGGFAPSIAWTANTDPDGASFFVNNTERILNIKAIAWIVEEANGSAATVTVVKAASGTSIAGGTAIHGAPLNANALAGQIQDIIPTLSMTLEIGERLGLQANATGGWNDSVASITVYLEP